MDRVYLSNGDRKATRNKNKTLDEICSQIQKLKKQKCRVDYFHMIEINEHPLVGDELPLILTQKQTGRETIVIRINGGDREQERKLIQEDDMAFWRAVKKGKATSAVEEFAILNQLGDANKRAKKRS